jgi:hypothetical protein
MHTQAELRDPSLFNFLGDTSLTLPIQDFSAQGVSNLLNAFAKLNASHQPVFARMSTAAMALPPTQFSSQSLANIVNAFVKAEFEDEQLMAWLSSVARHLPANEYSGQAIGIIVNAVCTHVCVYAYIVCVYIHTCE